MDGKAGVPDGLGLAHKEEEQLSAVAETVSSDEEDLYGTSSVSQPATQPASGAKVESDDDDDDLYGTPAPSSVKQGADPPCDEDQVRRTTLILRLDTFIC
jgi:hypothetical protein